LGKTGFSLPGKSRQKYFPQFSRMKFRDYTGRIYRHRFGRWILHILFWLFFFGARYYINTISLNPFKEYPRGILLNNLFATISTAFAYYVLIYFIYERLFRRKRFISAALVFVALVIVYTLLDFFFETILMP
jgi:hypothetical protein